MAALDSCDVDTGKVSCDMDTGKVTCDVDTDKVTCDVDTGKVSCDVDTGKVSQDLEMTGSLQPDSSSDVNTSTEGPEQTASAAAPWDLVMELYCSQEKRWPASGRHILAHFDDSSVVVYQAFKPSIAEFAVTHQRFGGPHYSTDRMTWIKTNFLWMMYRCGWGTKVDQERVLAVRIKRTAFDDILSQAHTGQKQKTNKAEKPGSTVRLQWDPDHGPQGEKLPRRAIQLGLKGKVLLDYTSSYILNIKDITDFVHEQYHILQTQGQHAILTPRETVYTPRDSHISDQLGLDFSPDHLGLDFSPDQTVLPSGH